MNIASVLLTSAALLLAYALGFFGGIFSLVQAIRKVNKNFPDVPNGKTADSNEKENLNNVDS